MGNVFFLYYQASKLAFFFLIVILSMVKSHPLLQLMYKASNTTESFHPHIFFSHSSCRYLKNSSNLSKLQPYFSVIIVAELITAKMLRIFLGRRVIWDQSHKIIGSLLYTVSAYKSFHKFSFNIIKPVIIAIAYLTVYDIF